MENFLVGIVVIGILFIFILIIVLMMKEVSNKNNEENRVKYRYNDIVRHKNGIHYTICHEPEYQEKEEIWYSVVEGSFNCLLDTLKEEHILLTSLSEKDIKLVKRIFDK